MDERSRAWPRRVGFAALGLLVAVGLVGCWPANTEVPPEVRRAVEAGRMDPDATQICSLGDVTLVAALDSSLEQLIAWGDEFRLSPDYEEYLPVEADDVAVCIFDARDIDALSDSLTYFGIWDTPGSGQGSLLAW